MFSFKLFLAVAAFVCVSARHIVLEDENRFYILPIEAIDDMVVDGKLVPERAERMRRQIQGSGTINSDGTSKASILVPVVDGEKNKLSAFGGVDLKDMGVARKTAGLSYENINGHGLELSKSFMPKADQLGAAGHVNLFNNDNHQVGANAFVARTMPKDSFTPDFNTYGGGVDYMYKQKLGAGVNVEHTPMWDSTKYGATGSLNLFRDKSSSLDFNAGLSKTVSPHMRSSLEPNYLFSYKRFF